MTPHELIKKTQTAPESIAFEDVMSVINDHYDYTLLRFVMVMYRMTLGQMKVHVKYSLLRSCINYQKLRLWLYSASSIEKMC